MQQQKADPIYEGCGVTKSCFGNPDNCVKTQSCGIVTTVIVLGDKYQFEIKSTQRKK